MTRNFNVADDVLTQYASNLLGYLEEDLPEFTAFDADLAEPIRDELFGLVDEALLEGGDELNVAKLGDLTQALLDQMAEARKRYHQLRYWVIKAFPTRKAVQRQFGVGRFRKASSSQEAMIAFYSGLVQSVKDYRPSLEAVKAPADLLDSIAVQAKALRDAQQAQEKKKGNRTVDTEERVVNLNRIFELTQLFNAAAEYVFFDSSAKRDRYRPPTQTDDIDQDDSPGE